MIVLVGIDQDKEDRKCKEGDQKPMFSLQAMFLSPDCIAPDRESHCGNHKNNPTVFIRSIFRDRRADMPATGE
jgi:hypothetical protein